MRLRTLVAALLPIALLASLVGVPTTAHADGVKALSLTGFADIVVDDAHGHVFISQDSATLLVFDLDGNPVGSVPNLYGAAGMALSEDGTKLWVALSDGDAVAAVDTSTLAATSYPTGVSTAPTSVAVTSGLVWFSHGGGKVGALDPTDGSVTLNLGSVSGSALLAASPAKPGELFAIGTGVSPTTLYAFTAANGETPTLSQRTSRWNTGSNGRDLAITPDGTKVVVAHGSPYEHPAFLTTDLSSAGSYASTNYPNAVAIRGDGMVAGGVDGTYDYDIYVYPAGSTSLLRKYELGGQGNELLDRGLAFGSSRLYAVSGDTYDDVNYKLHVITPRKPSSMTLTTDRSSYRYGAGAKVTVTLAAGTTNRSVSIYATPYGSAKKLVTTVQVPVGQSKTVSVAVHKRTTLSATNPGDEQYDAASASATVKVAARVTPKVFNSKGRAGKYYLFGPRARALLGALVSPNHGGQCLYFRLQFLVPSGRTIVSKCIKMTPKSVAGAYVDGHPDLIGVPFRMRAEWRGDTANLAARSAWRYMKFTR